MKTSYDRFSFPLLVKHQTVHSHFFRAPRLELSSLLNAGSRFPSSPMLTFLLILMISISGLRAGVIWQEGFEGATLGWTVEGSGNVWQKGIPTSGPGSAHTGSALAG